MTTTPTTKPPRVLTPEETRREAQRRRAKRQWDYDSDPKAEMEYDRQFGLGRKAEG